MPEFPINNIHYQYIINILRFKKLLHKPNDFKLRLRSDYIASFTQRIGLSSSFHHPPKLEYPCLT